MLIDPAESYLQKNSKVFIIPDGEFYDLNFETLIADRPIPHFWIEDADVSNASSLRVLFRVSRFPRPQARETACDWQQYFPEQGLPRIAQSG
jgi:hypothetical protein